MHLLHSSDAHQIDVQKYRCESLLTAENTTICMKTMWTWQLIGFFDINQLFCCFGDFGIVRIAFAFLFLVDCEIVGNIVCSMSLEAKQREKRAVKQGIKF